jgi:hypothetical protein
MNHALICSVLASPQGVKGKPAVRFEDEQDEDDDDEEDDDDYQEVRLVVIICQLKHSRTC